MQIQDDEPTRMIRRPQRASSESAPPPQPAGDSSDSVIKRISLTGARGSDDGGNQDTSAGAGGAVGQTITEQPEHGPVVGWVVIVDGPGRGASRSLGIGVNHIGRGAGLRVSLAFGDTEISVICQAEIIYNPKARQFIIRKGNDTTQLTYLGTDYRLVTHDTPLQSGDLISMGSTKLRFVAFCGEAFDWADTGAGVTAQ